MHFVQFATRYEGHSVGGRHIQREPDLDVRTEITSLQVGEALVSVLDETGSPTPVEKALVIPPCSQLGPIDAGQRKKTAGKLVVADVYDTAIDRLSAYEIIKEKSPRMQRRLTGRPETEKRMKEFQREFALKGGLDLVRLDRSANVFSGGDDHDVCKTCDLWSRGNPHRPKHLGHHHEGQMTRICLCAF